MGRAAALLCVVFCAGAVAPAATAQTPEHRIVLNGVGKAHGLGMAMDGVVGQGRAGWSAERMLSLFYPGSETARASGTIRVGLAEGGQQSFVLPGGGTVTDATGGASASAGYPMKVAAGKRITVVTKDGRPAVRVEGSSQPATAASTPIPSPPALLDARMGVRVAEADPGVPLTSPPPVLVPSPSPTPAPKAPSTTDRQEETIAAPRMSLHIIPAGDPALVLVDATGKRYRGVMEVRSAGGTLKVINHVGLETYVEGIAEARGAGWPLESMKTLAIAARSLGAATMSWYTKSRPNGYDICPTQNCQVYFGYDGEEAIMRRAVAETAGQIRGYKGTPILAMYHGNGGGQTESYHRVAGTTVSSHPYLKSVRYPHASPSTWRRELALTEVGAALVARGVNVPRPLERIEILERGDSPRVMRLGLHGGGKNTEVRGTTFMESLDLWSTWFDISDGGSFPTNGFAFPGGAMGSALDRQGVPRDAGSTWVFAFAAAIVALATAGAMQATADRLPAALRSGLQRPRAAPAASPRTP